MKLTKTDFEAWRELPMTRLVLDDFLGDEQAKTRSSHSVGAWNGPLNLEAHVAYRERYETLRFVRQTDFEDLDRWLKEKTEA